MNHGGMFAYIAHSGSMDIVVMRLNQKAGSLEKIQQISALGGESRKPGARSLPLAVSPDRRFIYAAIRAEPFVVAMFAIDGFSGELTYLGNAPLPGSMAYITTDRTGRYLFGVALEETKQKPRNSFIFVSPIGPQGFVQPATQMFRTEPKSHMILPDAANKTLTVTCRDGDCIMQSKFDQDTGELSPPTLPIRVKPGVGPRHFVFHPNYRYLYLLNEGDGSVHAYDYDTKTGNLNEMQIESAVPPDFISEEENSDVHAADIHMTPDGKYLYASVRSTSNIIAIFSVDSASGKITRLGFQPTEKGPRAFAIDPFGNYLLAAGQSSHHLSVYQIDHETGSLGELGRYEMNNKPDWVEILRLP